MRMVRQVKRVTKDLNLTSSELHDRGKRSEHNEGQDLPGTGCRWKVDQSLER
jgi:hypothetical protein